MKKIHVAWGPPGQSGVETIMGLGAAYTGHLKRRIGALAFVALNVLSLALVFAQPIVSALGITGVLHILAWHARASTPRASAA